MKGDRKEKQGQKGKQRKTERDKHVGREREKT
jgi:hypothetical protein